MYACLSMGSALLFLQWPQLLHWVDVYVEAFAARTGMCTGAHTGLCVPDTEKRHVFSERVNDCKAP